jgi:hypothetical protein
MINPPRFALISYGLLTCYLVGLSQGPSATKSKSTSSESKRIKILYDKANNKTTVSRPLMAVKEVPGTIEARFPEGTRNLPSETLHLTAACRRASLANNRLQLTVFTAGEPGHWMDEIGTIKEADFPFLISNFSSNRKFSTHRLDRALVPRRVRRTSPLSKQSAEAMAQ